VGAGAGRTAGTALPAGISRALAKLNSKGIRPHDSLPVKDYRTAVTS
jgi:hypothetical protein